MAVLWTCYQYFGGLWEVGVGLGRFGYLDTFAGGGGIIVPHDIISS